MIIVYYAGRQRKKAYEISASKTTTAQCCPQGIKKIVFARAMSVYVCACVCMCVFVCACRASFNVIIFIVVYVQVWFDIRTGFYYAHA